MIYKVTTNQAIFYIAEEHVTPFLPVGTVNDFETRRALLRELVRLIVIDWEMVEADGVPAGIELYTPWTVEAAIKSQSPMTDSENRQRIYTELQIAMDKQCVQAGCWHGLGMHLDNGKSFISYGKCNVEGCKCQKYTTTRETMPSDRVANHRNHLEVDWEAPHVHKFEFSYEKNFIVCACGAEADDCVFMSKEDADRKPADRDPRAHYGELADAMKAKAAQELTFITEASEPSADDYKSIFPPQPPNLGVVPTSSEPFVVSKLEEAIEEEEVSAVDMVRTAAKLGLMSFFRDGRLTRTETAELMEVAKHIAIEPSNVELLERIIAAAVEQLQGHNITWSDGEKMTKESIQARLSK